MSNPIILIVEDDPTLRMLTQKQVSMLGNYNIESVDNGEAAVLRSRPDVGLILMDIGLPGIDGINATLMIREKELNENRKRVPIIALTGHGEKSKSLMAGMDDFLQKPAMVADIKQILDKYLPFGGDENSTTKGNPLSSPAA